MKFSIWFEFRFLNLLVRLDCPLSLSWHVEFLALPKYFINTYPRCLNDTASSALTTCQLVIKNFSNIFKSKQLHISLEKSPNLANLQSSEKIRGSHTGLVLGVMVGMVRKLSQKHITVKYHNVLGHCFEVASLCKEREQHQKSCTRLFYM